MASSCSSDDSPGNQAPEKTILMAPSDKDTDVEITNLELKWSEATDPNSDPVSYQVYLDTVNPPVAMVTGNLTGTTFTLLEDLQYGTTYYWSIIAQDDGGAQSLSTVATFTTKEKGVDQKIIGKWMVEGLTDSGTFTKANPCNSKSYFEFKANGELDYIAYNGNPCSISSSVLYYYQVSGEDTVYLKVSKDTPTAYVVTIISISDTHMELEVDANLVYSLARQ